MNDLGAIQGMGLLPTPAYLAGLILFSVIGYAAYRYGRKAERPRVKWLGVALMLYAYATPETWQLYAVGGVLSAALYWV